MASAESTYQPVISGRYCRGSPLLKLFSEQTKIETWRQLWINLAEAEKELGLMQISDEMIGELKAQKSNINWEMVKAEEKRLRHDVMAHNHCYGMVCPKAAGIIHLGATSCYVQDNADLIIQREALKHLASRMVLCLKRLAEFAKKYSATVTVGRTHYQAASPITVGKRACMWARDLLSAFKKLTRFAESIEFRGIKGATGTQDSFMTLFHGNEDLVEQLDVLVMKKAGFSHKFLITGQTYSREQDNELIFVLSNFASVAKKICTDIRVLQAFGELSEPFEETQIGSSAMPYKRNPIRSERVCGLARDLMCAVLNPLQTLSDQGLERTLDDSANRRVVINDAFLTAEAILTILQNIFEGLVVHEQTIARNVANELPFLALEKALMYLTELNISRQEAHSKIRETAFKGKDILEKEGRVTIQQLLDDPFFEKVRDKVIDLASNPINFCGRCESLVARFLAVDLEPTIKPYMEGVQDQRATLDV